MKKIKKDKTNIIDLQKEFAKKQAKNKKYPKTSKREILEAFIDKSGAE